MKCEKYLEMIDDLVEGDLDEQNARQVNLHIFTCQECEYHYETLKQERQMYEQHFEIESSTQLWTEFQTKLKVTKANNIVKSSNIFVRLFDWKSNIFERLKLTPALACAALLFIVGISFG
ncbi:MAG TPA: zf-HC2 domain-containing protein, partial [Pyrinomonadaceae bacterium]|nr:zf-HC2 domain-containing protein [Pyrinomonadaceae bacterium]